MRSPIYARLFLAAINAHRSFALTVSLLFVVGVAVVGPIRNQPVDAHTGPNSAPIAVDDGPHTVHESLLLPQVMTNDSDPDGDTISFDIIGTNPAHGNLSFGATPGIILYRATQAGYVGTSMSYSYDSVGNLTQRTDYNGAIITFAHDDLNRLTTINYPDSTSAAYTYDALSRVTAATNQNGTVTLHTIR